MYIYVYIYIHIKFVEPPLQISDAMRASYIKFVHKKLRL